MKYALLPFPAHDLAREQRSLPDIRAALRGRSNEVANGALRNLDLLDHIVELLQALPWKVWTDYCHEKDGRLHLAVFGSDLGRNLELDDQINAGFYLQNCEQRSLDTTACTRVYRVACSNGAIVECEKGQSFTLRKCDSVCRDWRSEITKVVTHSFSGDGIDADAARFRRTMTEMVVSPYEWLCHLSAGGLIDDDEERQINAAFAEVADFSVYGFINAVTQVAHHLRSDNRWTRAFHIERLGGEILRGDHNLPSRDLTPAR